MHFVIEFSSSQFYIIRNFVMSTTGGAQVSGSTQNPLPAATSATQRKIVINTKAKQLLGLDDFVEDEGDDTLVTVSGALSPLALSYVLTGWGELLDATDYPRGPFMINLMKVGLNYGFTEETSTLGSFLARTDPNDKSKTVLTSFVSVIEKARSVILTKLGASVTFRQIGASIARNVPEILTHTSITDLQRTGTVISRRLNVDNELSFCTSSIFTYIKAPATWTVRERDAFDAHRHSVTKTSSTNLGPMDLRIDPTAAATRKAASVLSDTSTAASANDPYAKGLDMLAKMAGGIIPSMGTQAVARPNGPGRTGLSGANPYLSSGFVSGGTI